MGCYTYSGMEILTSTPSHPGIALAALALRRGFVTAREVQVALGEQAREAEDGKISRDIGLTLLSQGALSEETLQMLLGDLQILEVPEISKESVFLPSPLEKWGRRFGKYVL